MALLQTRKDKVGNLLKHEYAPEMGFCREAGTVDLDSTTVLASAEVGSVLTFTGGKWIAYLDANVADPIGVLIDETVYDLTAAEIATDVAGLAILVNGPAIVREAALKLDTTGVTSATAIAALKAANIKTAEFLK